MAVNIPHFMVGRHVSAVTIWPQTIDADGTLADIVTGGSPFKPVESAGTLHVPPPSGSAFSFITCVCETVGLTKRRLDTNLSSMASTRAHHVRLAYGWGFTATEILRSGLVAQSFLTQLWNSYAGSVCRIRFGRSRDTWQLYALLTGYEEGGGKGKYGDTVTFSSVGLTDSTLQGVIVTATDR